jgi:hypothetical protein
MKNSAHAKQNTGIVSDWKLTAIDSGSSVQGTGFGQSLGS